MGKKKKKGQNINWNLIHTNQLINRELNLSIIYSKRINQTVSVFFHLLDLQNLKKFGIQGSNNRENSILTFCRDI